MSRIVVNTELTLDGVMQAPGRPDEDLRGGFAHGGWAQPYAESVMEARWGGGAPTPGPILFGRRTYEGFASVWPHMPDDNPFAALMNNVPKYVASTTLQEPLPWKNSTLLSGDAAGSVARLKEQPGEDIVVIGSGDLIQTLMRHNLVDEYTLVIYPVVLGTGRRLFNDGGAFADLRLVDTITATSGVIIATYQPVEPVEEKSV